MTRLQGPILIVGYGLSGQAAHRLLKVLGYVESEISIYDEKNPVARFNHPESLGDFAPKTLVVSPGFPLRQGWIQELVKRGSHLCSEIDLACGTLQQEKIIGVTGSSGKSTTTSLIGEGLKVKDPHAFVGGNLGIPLAQYAAEVLEQRRPRSEWMVLELSSYQLENSKSLRLEASVITHLSANHLERYNDLTDYYGTKWQIVSQTKKVLIYNLQSADLVKWVKDHSTLLPSKGVDSHHSRVSHEWLSRSLLPGTHNHDNLAMATEVLLELGWTQKELVPLLQFAGLSHRLERLMLSFEKPIFVNDSKATSMVSVNSALSSLLGDAHLCGEKTQIWCLLGGKDKNLPWENLGQWKEHSQLRFVFFGACGALAQEKSKLPGMKFPTLRPALESLKSLAQQDDLVLLSPGGTSLDEFKNFEERGQKFAQWAEEIFK